jgi:steroid delta-isomerase-like uncharacterized protein
MSIEANKNLVRRLWYEEFWDKRNTDLASDLFTPDYALHMAGVPGTVDREGIKQLVHAFGAAFRFTHAVEEMVAEGDTVAARWSVRGTHQGEFQGMAPTGKPIHVTGITIHHCADGRIHESWVMFDSMTLLHQLGAVPATGT